MEREKGGIRVSIYGEEEKRERDELWEAAKWSLIYIGLEFGGQENLKNKIKRYFQIKKKKYLQQVTRFKLC